MTGHAQVSKTISKPAAWMVCTRQKCLKVFKYRCRCSCIWGNLGYCTLCISVTIKDIFLNYFSHELTFDLYITANKVTHRLQKLDIWLMKLLMSQWPFYLKPALPSWSLKQPSYHLVQLIFVDPLWYWKLTGPLELKLGTDGLWIPQLLLNNVFFFR